MVYFGSGGGGGGALEKKVGWLPFREVTSVNEISSANSTHRFGRFSIVEFLSKLIIQLNSFCVPVYSLEQNMF